MQSLTLKHDLELAYMGVLQTKTWRKPYINCTVGLYRVTVTTIYCKDCEKLLREICDVNLKEGNVRTST